LHELKKARESQEKERMHNIDMVPIRATNGRMTRGLTQVPNKSKQGSSFLEAPNPLYSPLLNHSFADNASHQLLAEHVPEVNFDQLVNGKELQKLLDEANDEDNDQYDIERAEALLKEAQVKFSENK
jgi:hypothetical protein